jgi:hypothetical protein
MKTRLKFLGAAENVTGSASAGDRRHRFLIDCGMHQERESAAATGTVPGERRQSTRCSSPSTPGPLRLSSQAGARRIRRTDLLYTRVRGDHEDLLLDSANLQNRMRSTSAADTSARGARDSP